MQGLLVLEPTQISFRSNMSLNKYVESRIEPQYATRDRLSPKGPGKGKQKKIGEEVYATGRTNVVVNSTSGSYTMSFDNSGNAFQMYNQIETAVKQALLGETPDIYICRDVDEDTFRAMEEARRAAAKQRATEQVEIAKSDLDVDHPTPPDDGTGVSGRRELPTAATDALEEMEASGEELPSETAELQTLVDGGDEAATDAAEQQERAHNRAAAKDAAAAAVEAEGYEADPETAINVYQCITCNHEYRFEVSDPTFEIACPNIVGPDEECGTLNAPAAVVPLTESGNDDVDLDDLL